MAGLMAWAWAGLLPLPGLGRHPGLGLDCRAAGPAQAAVREARGPGRGLADCPARVRYLFGERINVNSASAEDLDLLPGLGPQAAARIIAARDQARGFATRDQLQSIPGVSRTARDSLARWGDVE